MLSCTKDVESEINNLDAKAAVNKNTTAELELVAEDLVSPVGVVPVPDGSGRLFIIDQIGKIWIVDKEGNKLDEPFLDVSDEMIDLWPGYDERGLLGLAFHPDYASNGRFFVYYVAPPEDPDYNNLSRIAEFHVSSDTNKADKSTEKAILEIDQPQFNHEGGTIAFGPDGYLYISIGDGGNKNDIGFGHVSDWYATNEGGNGQDIEQNLLGNILRIDVDSGDPYGIPADNPFAGDIPGMDEIYAYGFRNPFRFSFDMSGSHQLYVGDAGQVMWEEISLVEKGGNYGWNVKEATHCFDASNNTNILSSCPDVDQYGNELIDPVIEMMNYANPLPGEGKTVAIIGGYVYRGNELPGFQGKYIFGSLAKEFEEGEGPNGNIFISNPAGPGLWSFQELNVKIESEEGEGSGEESEEEEEGIGYYVKGFGQDWKGEIYVAASKEVGPQGNTGKIFKLVRAEKEKSSR
ncbi:hypothetical protein C7S20_00945 [Christiangramia fulva]|uniref:Glucose/Sorbosone dehydrogenase domain-containing protein n=2 Tax=Christiangramia fulva TaxID=2126553 RepID=A0A2R3ZAG4_9FLAO|nr:hypothetical protein C7S20_00945 [Christiangramia fulva]